MLAANVKHFCVLGCLLLIGCQHPVVATPRYEYRSVAAPHKTSLPSLRSLNQKLDKLQQNLQQLTIPVRRHP